MSDSNIPPSTRFEKRIQDLLKKLSFSSVDGGNDFHIGKEQVDAAGMFEEQLFIVECSTQIKDHKAKIQTIPTKKKPIHNGAQRLDRYKRFKDIHFIYAINNNSILEETKNVYEEDNEINILRLDDVKYFETLSEKLETRAPYDFLTQLGIEPLVKDELRIPALKHKIRNKTLYSFFADPNEIARYSYVARRDLMRDDFYQRMVNTNKLKSIHEYLSDGNSYIPTNVVLGLNDKAEFESKSEEGDVEMGFLKLPNSYNACFVIDGQHRLFSYTSGLKQKLSFVAIDNIHLEEQMRQFVDINQNADPIDSNLMWDLRSRLDHIGEMGRISLAAKQLNEREPFIGLIRFPGSDGNRISLSAICIALEKTKLASETIKNPVGRSTVRNKFQDNDSERFAGKLSRALSSYFETLTATDNQDLKDFILSQGGVTVFIYLFRSIIYEIQNGRMENDPSSSAAYIRDILNNTSDSTLDDYKKNAGGSEAGKKRVLNDFLGILSEHETCLQSHIEIVEDGLTAKNKELEQLIVDYSAIALQHYSESTVKKWFNRDWNGIVSKLPNGYTPQEFPAKLSIGNKAHLLKMLLRSEEKTLVESSVRTDNDVFGSSDPRFKDVPEVERTLESLASIRNRNEDQHTQLPSEKLTEYEKRIAQTNYDRVISCIKRALESIKAPD